MMAARSRTGCAREETNVLDMATLDERLTRECREASASFIGETIFGALVEKPNGPVV